MATRPTEERIAALDEKMKQLKAQKKALQNRARAEERKKRTHRLIQSGAILEKYCGEIVDLEAWEKYVKQYAGAIKQTQQMEKPKKNNKE